MHVVKETIIARHHSKIELPGIQGVCKMELLSKPQNERFISTHPVLFCNYKENVQIENIFGQFETSHIIAIFSEKSNYFFDWKNKPYSGI